MDWGRFRYNKLKRKTVGFKSVCMKEQCARMELCTSMDDCHQKARIH